MQQPGISRILIFVAFFFQGTLSMLPVQAQWRIEGRVGEFSGNAVGYASVQCTGFRAISAITDSTGNFMFSGLPSGEYVLQIRHLSYQPWHDTIKLTADTLLTVSLQPAGQELREVTISQTRHRLQPANIWLSHSDIAAKASMLGEANIYEALQQQAGVIHSGDLNPGLYVRGTSSGHTGTMVEGMATLAGNHLLGIYPPFNADAFGSVRLLKEDISVQHGGYLGAYLMLDVRDDMPDKIRGSAEIGILTSKLSLDLPIVPDKISLTTHIRRSYFDLIARSYNHIKRNQSDYLPLPMYGFYDINNTLQVRTGAKSKLKLVTLFTGDRFDMSGRLINMSGKWANQLIATSWAHHFSNRLQVQIQAGLNMYQAQLNYPETVQKEVDNKVRETMLQARLNWEAGKNWSFVTGMFARYHNLSLENKSLHDTFVSDHSYIDKSSYNWGAYLESVFSPGDLFRFRLGVRADSYHFGSRLLYLSPIASVSANIVGGNALLSVRRQLQFAHLFIPLGVKIPINIWYPSDHLSPPEEAWNTSLSYTRLLDKRFKVNFALYYILLDKQVEFMQSNYFSSLDFKTETGSGTSKGIEFGLSCQEAQWQANLQYTLGKSDCRFSEINNGQNYSLSYDIRHKFDLTLVYCWHPRWTISLAQFVQSGFVMTVPTGIFVHQSADQGNADTQIVPLYSDRNNFRMPLSHRMDISLKHNFKIYGLDASWTAGIYNVYAYKNPFFVTFVPTGDQTRLKAKSNSLLPLVPFISLRVMFN